MADFTFADLAALGTPDIVEMIDYESTLSSRKAQLTALMQAAGVDYDVALLETDPAIVCLEEAAYEEVILRARGNDIARQRYLYWARKAALDHLGAFYDTPRMTGELDDRYVDRIIAGIQGRSTAGTAARYRYVALSASLRVADAKVYRVGTDPTVHVAVFSTDSTGVADADLLATVRAALTADDVMMISDTIAVRSAVVTVVDVVAALTLLPSTAETLLSTLAASLPASWNAVKGLGRDLTIDWLKAALMVPGVYGAAITSPPADRLVDPYSAISIGSVTLTLAGRAF